MSKKIAKNPEIDPTLPKVAISLGGSTYYLCYNFGALATAASKFREMGLHINVLRLLDFSSLDADQVAPLLYAGLITHQSQLTFDEVTSFISLQNIGEVLTKVSDAYFSSFSEPKSGDAEGKPQPDEQQS